MKTLSWGKLTIYIFVLLMIVSLSKTAFSKSIAVYPAELFTKQIETVFTAALGGSESAVCKRVLPLLNRNIYLPATAVSAQQLMPYSQDQLAVIDFYTGMASELGFGKLETGRAILLRDDVIFNAESIQNGIENVMQALFEELSYKYKDLSVKEQVRLIDQEMVQVYALIVTNLTHQQQKIYMKSVLSKNVSPEDAGQVQKKMLAFISAITDPLNMPQESSLKKFFSGSNINPDLISDEAEQVIRRAHEKLFAQLAWQWEKMMESGQLSIEAVEAFQSSLLSIRNNLHVFGILQPGERISILEPVENYETFIKLMEAAIKVEFRETFGLMGKKF